MHMYYVLFITNIGHNFYKLIFFIAIYPIQIARLIEVHVQYNYKINMEQIVAMNPSNL